MEETESGEEYKKIDTLRKLIVTDEIEEEKKFETPSPVDIKKKKK